eukprot:SAG31_NODE_159_length_21911_cov_12.220750_17_plen_152_part_00
MSDICPAIAQCVVVHSVAFKHTVAPVVRHTTASFFSFASSLGSSKRPQLNICRQKRCALSVLFAGPRNGFADAGMTSLAVRQASTRGAVRTTPCGARICSRFYLNLYAGCNFFESIITKECYEPVSRCRNDNLDVARLNQCSGVVLTPVVV